MEGNAFAAFETFLSQPLYVMVRFGRWDDVLAEPKPMEGNQFMVGVWHYARGIAFSNTGKAREARKELNALNALRDALGPDYAIGFGPAPKLLTIASQVLSGDIAAKAGDMEQAIAALSRAARLEDSLLYNEPPDWYFPTRHVLGALLLEAGHPGEAEVIYWEDLKKNPGNGYSLWGLYQTQLAQGNDTGAAEIKAAFDAAWANADVELSSSRF